jgi:conjugal transfer pilus assembly protein TraE
VQKSSNLFAERRLLRLIVLLIGGLAALNCLLLFVAMDRQRTIIVPVGAMSRISVAGSSADVAYLREMGRYVVGLALTYSPGTVRRQYEELLGLFSPEYYLSARQQFADMADTAEMARASSVFFLDDIQDDKGKVLAVSGVRKLFVEDQKTTEERVTFQVHYTIKDGRFMLAGFTEKGGS